MELEKLKSIIESILFMSGEPVKISRIAKIAGVENPEVENAFSLDYVKMGNYLNSLSPEIQKYVIVNRPGVPVPWPDGIPMPAQTIMFIENTKYGSPQSNYLLPKDLDKIKIEKDTIILPMKYEKDLFEDLQKRFPEGEIKKINEIWFYYVQ